MKCNYNHQKYNQTASFQAMIITITNLCYCSCLAQAKVCLSNKKMKYRWLLLFCIFFLCKFPHLYKNKESMGGNYLTPPPPHKQSHKYKHRATSSVVLHSLNFLSPSLDPLNSTFTNHIFRKIKNKTKFSLYLYHLM